VEPRRSSFFDTLVEDNLRARYVQDIRTFEYSARVEELAGFFRDQRWMHMHAVLRSKGITSTEFARRGGERSVEAALAILAEDGFSREEALRAIGKRLRKGALGSLERQGFTGEGGTRSASTELAHRGLGGALASLERQGFTGEDGTASASTELSRRGGDAYSAIYRRSGDCSRPGCTYAIARGDLCIHHQPKKTKKIDNCKDCGRVFDAKVKVRGGVCYPCYKKPETTAARKKAGAAKKEDRKTCSTPGCSRITDRGTDKCYTCKYPSKS
jgi:hypothetical protein